MISASELKQKAEKKIPLVYDFLIKATADSVLGTSDAQADLFPLSLICDKGDFSKDFAQWFESVQELQKSSKAAIGYGYTLVYGPTVASRTCGDQSNISDIRFDKPSDILRFTGKEAEAALLTSITSVMLQALHPQRELMLRGVRWVLSNKGEIIKKQEPSAWRDIIFLAITLKDERERGIFPREVDASLDTKFLERNRRLVISLASALEPENETLSNSTLSWEHRLGLRRKDDMIHIRFPHQILLATPQGIKCGETDHVTVPRESFRRCTFTDVHNVFVIENETVFLTFPLQTHDIAVYRGGFAITALADAPWLDRVNIHYFSDLDEHGFAMLDMMRRMYPHTDSFCMDRRTLDDFSRFREEGAPYTGEMLTLTEEETQTLNTLRANSSRNRLEQEHISVSYIMDRIDEIPSDLEEVEQQQGMGLFDLLGQFGFTSSRSSRRRSDEYSDFEIID